MLFYSQDVRDAFDDAVVRVKEGEDVDVVIKDMMERYPTSMTFDKEHTLKIIARNAQKELRGYRDSAIKELRRIGFPTTEENIKNAIKQLRNME